MKKANCEGIPAGAATLFLSHLKPIQFDSKVEKSWSISGSVSINDSNRKFLFPQKHTYTIDPDELLLKRSGIVITTYSTTLLRDWIQQKN